MRFSRCAPALCRQNAPPKWQVSVQRAEPEATDEPANRDGSLSSAVRFDAYKGSANHWGLVPTPRTAPMRKLVTEIKMLARKAVPKLEIVNPLTSAETSRSITALITSKKMPRVSTVRGNVRTINIGRTIAFTNPSTKAAIISEETSANWMPPNTRLATHRDIDVTTQ